MRAFLGIPLAMLLAGCQILLRYEPFEGGDAVGAAGRRPQEVGGAAGAVGGGQPTGGASTGGTPARCTGILPAQATEHGPTPILAHEDEERCLYVDETEVTRAQYAEFLAAVGSVDEFNVEGCRGGINPSFDGGAGGADAGPSVPQTPSGYPVVGVDWCDAAAFCRWTERELCGTYQGAPLFQQACWDFASVRAEDPFSTAGVCNAGADSLEGVRFGECETPAGIWDLVGNVAEWTAECRDERPASRECSVRGGSFENEGVEVSCDAARSLPASGRWDSIGFRCCLKLTKE